MKRLLPFVFAFCLIPACSPESDAQVHAYFSPGLKLGYVLGENGGFVLGFEASLTFESNPRHPIFYGVVISHDQCAQSEWSRIHFGLQASGLVDHAIAAGLEIGPTWIYGKENRTGFTSTAFTGGFLFLTLSYHRFEEQSDAIEPGFLAKFHIPLYRVKF